MTAVFYSKTNESLLDKRHENKTKLQKMWGIWLQEMKEIDDISVLLVLVLGPIRGRVGIRQF